MTSEVAILNREAVAMAADSASTLIGGANQKIFVSTTKIHALTNNYPVGIMFYGNSHFMGTLWETVIKLYRKHYGDLKYNTLKKYSEHFIKFLKDNKSIFSKDQQDIFVNTIIYNFLQYLRYVGINKEIERLIADKGEISEDDIQTEAEIYLKGVLIDFQNGETNFEKPLEIIQEIISAYKNMFNNMISQVFEKFPFNQKSKKLLLEILASYFVYYTNRFKDFYSTGIVICGFGEEEIFPSMISLNFVGIIEGNLKYRVIETASIEANGSIIRPFAQSEMAETFIKGISPLLQESYEKMLKKITSSLPEQIINNIELKMDAKSKKKVKESINKIVSSKLDHAITQFNIAVNQQYELPITQLVTLLPKNELAEMAEALVNLTCLRKKISLDDDTVGGPIDVAIITRGDGLVWYKRKQLLNNH
jgi:formate dehydrogenase maturation protein FdhE